MFSIYYQAQVQKEKVWFFTATLRSFEHLVFDRTFDKERSIFEFFVPADLEKYFLDFMDHMQKINIVTHLEKKDNRFAHQG